jgi:predicted XRE-type DNA-binding protein
MKNDAKDEDLELVRGSGNVFRDFNHPNAGLEQARAIVAAEIISVLDDKELSTRDAEKKTGVAHSEFSHIRNAQLSRFTLDRMITILGKLDEEVEVNVTFHPRVSSDVGSHLAF